MNRLMLCVSVAACIFGQVAVSQVTYSLEDTAASIAPSPVSYLPSGGYSTGGSDPRGPMDLPQYGNLPPSAVGADIGGFAIDQKRDRVYACNGFWVQEEGHPYYATPTLSSSAGLGTYFPSNHITGMAVDATNELLYCIDDRRLRSFDISGTPATYALMQGALSPINLSWLNSGVVLTGLGYEPSTGHLWACASNGHIYKMQTDGFPVGPQPVSIVNSTATLSGLAVNTCNGVGAMAFPAQSFQVNGYHILVSDGVNLYDATNSLAAPIPLVGGSGFSRGLAFSSDGQLLPAASSCPLTGTYAGNPNLGTGSSPGIRTSSAAVLGNTNSLQLLGGPHSAQALLLFDLAPIYGGIAIPTGDLLYIWPLSPTVVTAWYSTDAFGVADFAIPLAMAPAGVQFTYQWYFPDNSNPTIYGCFSDAMTVTVGLP